VRIADRETATNGGAARGIVDRDKSPWLTETDRRRQRGNVQQLVKHSLGDWLTPKAADVAPPPEQIRQLPAECAIEFGHDGT
jgi:hypothetical protein